MVMYNRKKLKMPNPVTDMSKQQQVARGREGRRGRQEGGRRKEEKG